MERLVRLGSWLSLALVLLPLLGLAAAAIDPPPDPFGGPPPRAADVLSGGLLGVTVALGLIVTALSVGVGGWLAWVEARADYPGRAPLGVLGLLPMAMPSYVLAATVATTLGPGGWVGKPLGLPVFSGFWGATLVLVVATAPYVQLVVGAALGRLSASEEEAARTLGASRGRVLRVVILPRVRPALVLSGLIALLYAISDFGAVAVLDVPVLTWRLYEAVRTQDLGRAAWMGIALLLIILPVFAATAFLRGDRAAGTVANPRPPRRVAPGPASLALTYGLHALVIGVGVLIPTLTLGGWVVEGLQRGEAFAPLWRPARDSLLAAGIGAALTVLFAGFVARSGGRLREQAVYLTSALPGVLLAFGLILSALAVTRAVGGGRAMYGAVLGSGALLFIGYVTRFLAEVYGPLKTAFEQLDPRQRETARALGASSWTWLVRVGGPAVAPGAAAAFSIGFLAILKELPITLMLGGATGLSTLAFRVWDRYSESLWHDAGAAGLALVGLALVVLTLTLRWRRHV